MDLRGGDLDLLAFLDLEDLYVDDVLDDDDEEEETLLFCFIFLLPLDGEYSLSSLSFFLLIFSLVTECDGNLCFFCSLALALALVAEP